MKPDKIRELRQVILRYKILCRVPPVQVKTRTDKGLFYESQFTAMASTRWTGRKPQCP